MKLKVETTGREKKRVFFAFFCFLFEKTPKTFGKTSTFGKKKDFLGVQNGLSCVPGEVLFFLDI